MAESDDRSGPPDEAVPPDARERVVDALTRGFANDQLSESQLETLLDQVYRAGTLAELDAVMGSLPVVAAGDAGAVAETPPAEPGVAAAAPVQVRALLSGQERRLTGVVPRRMQLRARLGYVELDLTRATFQPGLTEIDVRALMGYVQIRFPHDVQVENDGGAFLGYFALKGGGSGNTVRSDCVVRVTGRAVMGFAECFVFSGRPETG